MHRSVLAGRYEILERLAAGGMGEVFRAQFRGPEGFYKPVVIKQIFPDSSQDSEHRRLFIREATVASQLLHPNIVQVHELGEEAGQLFIAMELVEGCDLRGLSARALERGETLASAPLCVIAYDVLEALDFAHHHQDPEGRALTIVHQDVSPQNILVSRFGHAKLCDFGVARIRGLDHTTHANVRGKLNYMAPEQLQGLPVDGRTDIYALGVVLYECLSAITPFTNRSLSDIRRAQEHVRLAPLHSVAPTQDEELCAAVDRAVEPDPAARFAGAAEFRAAVEAVLARLGPNPARQSVRDLVAAATQSAPLDEVSAARITLPERWSTLVDRAPARASQAPSQPVAPRPSKRRAWLAGAAGLGAAAVLALALGLAQQPAHKPTAPNQSELATAIAEQPALVPVLPEPAVASLGKDPDPARPRGSGKTRQNTKPEPRRAATAPVEYGALTLNAVPWARVTIDGLPLQKVTPLRNLRLPAGKHTIVLVSSTNQRRELQVEIKAGEVLTELVRFLE